MTSSWRSENATRNHCWTILSSQWSINSIQQITRKFFIAMPICSTLILALKIVQMLVRVFSRWGCSSQSQGLILDKTNLVTQSWPRPDTLDKWWFFVFLQADLYKNVESLPRLRQTKHKAFLDPNKPLYLHDDVIKWKHFPRYWPFVRGIHRSPVNSSHKGQWRGALMFPLICVWINDWVNSREAGDVRCYRAHYDVIAMA